MSLLEEVRTSCRQVSENARWVWIDADAAAALDPPADLLGAAPASASQGPSSNVSPQGTRPPTEPTPTPPPPAPPAEPPPAEPYPAEPPATPPPLTGPHPPTPMPPPAEPSPAGPSPAGPSPAAADSTDPLQAAAPPTPPPPALDPELHYLEGSTTDVADYMLALDAINFGSGWFPTLQKRERGGRPLGGYFTVAWAFADHVRANGPPSAGWLRRVGTREVAAMLGQRADNELIGLYAQAWRELGRFLGERRTLDIVAESGGSAERLAETLAGRMAMWHDSGFYKRAQIVPSDLALAGVAQFQDLDRLTVFADNVVPHVLRCEGVLVYDPALAARIDAGMVLPRGGPEREIRACAVQACELVATRTGVPPRMLDNWLWNRGQAPEYKARPRHRCRNVFY